VLDLFPVGEGEPPSRVLRQAASFAQGVEALGYRRYWVAEHHNMPSIASAAPEVLIAHIAGATTRIRVGAGGMMLPNHTPLRLVEIFRTLEALYPNRIDLGIGRAPGTDPVTSSALRRGGEDVDQILADFWAFNSGTFPSEHPYSRITAMPSDVLTPPIWMLGSTKAGALIAAQLGTRYAFAGHFSMEYADAALAEYYQNFRPSPALAAPEAILAVSVICGATDEEAEAMAAPYRLAMARLRTGRPAAFASRQAAVAHQWTAAERAAVEGHSSGTIVGGSDRVGEALFRLFERSGVGELMVSTPVTPLADRLASYERVARLILRR
jgi:luciferase family oxidoreductase group 1